MTAATATGKNEHGSGRLAVLLFLIFFGILVGACGNDKTQTQTQVQTPVGDDLVGTSLRSELAGTMWKIVEMAGFPDDNVAEGSMTFSEEGLEDGFKDEGEWFGHYDGVNWSSSTIKWNESGFTVTAQGATTNAGMAGGENRYLDTFFSTGARIDIIKRADGSLVLTRDQSTVIAEPVASGQGTVESAEEENLDPVGIKLEVQQYARDFGVSEDEALRRFDRDDELKAMVQEIVAAETGRVAGWGLVHDPEFGGWVYLVGDAEPTAFTKQLAAQHSDLLIELGATHTLDELATALENNVDRESIPVSMRDRIAYTDIDIHSNSIVVAIDRNKPPVPIDDAVPTAERPIESLDLPRAAEALEALLEQATGLPFSVTLDSRSVPGVG